MTDWINDVEGMIKRHITKEDITTKLKYPEDKNTDLLAPEPYDKMYREYLKAMIRYESRDYPEYNNDIEMFNASFKSYSEYYVRENKGSTSNKIINYW